jgi:translation initiation factor 1 (eIF-1/SUI1)
VRTEAPAPATAAPRAAATPLNEQLAKPIFTLRTAPSGDHVMTLQVTPENLGPVTVRAHVGTDGIRIELIAATDQAREALRGILSDLKRDLSTGGMPASLDLAPDDRSSPGRDATPERRERSDEPRGAYRSTSAPSVPTATGARAAADPSSRLDVVV